MLGFGCRSALPAHNLAGALTLANNRTAFPAAAPSLGRSADAPLKMLGFGCRSAALVFVISGPKISGGHSQEWRAGIFGRRRATKSPTLAKNRQSEPLSLFFLGVFKVRFSSAALLLFFFGRFFSFFCRCRPSPGGLSILTSCPGKVTKYYRPQSFIGSILRNGVKPNDLRSSALMYFLTPPISTTYTERPAFHSRSHSDPVRYRGSGSAKSSR